MAASNDYSYTVIFEPLERGGYQAVVPALPEIITAGRTLKEARRMARDAIRCVLDRKSTRLNSSHIQKSRMPSSA